MKKKLMGSEAQPYDQEMCVALALAREAGAAILEFYQQPFEVQQKDSFNHSEPVTEADRVANQLIVTTLAREFSHDGILAEESVDTFRRLDKQRVWMVDPLDGTTGFIDGNGDFAVQIGLAENGKAVLGVVYQPLTGVLYRAVKGAGCWIERPDLMPERATVSDRSDLHLMRLAASRSHRSPRMDKVVSSFAVKEEVRRGSVGIKVGLICEQQCDLYIHLSPRTKQWDTCAPEIILAEAGGRMTDLFGESLVYNVLEVQNRNGIVASNGVVHEEIVNTLAPLLEEFGRIQV
jgi:3'(2'), 5'-bisphosphate nucleotidase